MIISMIVAVAENNVIGKDNGMLWKLPADLKYFKTITMGHHILMGRKTYEAMGGSLPGRTNVIITRQENYAVKDANVVNSLEAAIKFAEQNGETEAMILGGGTIYEQAISMANRIYLTRVHGTFEGDTLFPELDETTWIETKQDKHEADDKNPLNYTFLEYERR